MLLAKNNNNNYKASDITEEVTPITLVQDLVAPKDKKKSLPPDRGYTKCDREKLAYLGLQNLLSTVVKHFRGNRRSLIEVMLSSVNRTEKSEDILLGQIIQKSQKLMDCILLSTNIPFLVIEKCFSAKLSKSSLTEFKTYFNQLSSEGTDNLTRQKIKKSILQVTSRNYFDTSLHATVAKNIRVFINGERRSSSREKILALLKQEKKQLKAYINIQARCQIACQIFALKHFSTIEKVIRNNHSSGLSKEDLFQIGSTRLIHAAMMFDPLKNTRYGTYAELWIREIIKRQTPKQKTVLPITDKDILLVYRNLGEMQKWIDAPINTKKKNTLTHRQATLWKAWQCRKNQHASTIVQEDLESYLTEIKKAKKEYIEKVLLMRKRLFSIESLDAENKFGTSIIDRMEADSEDEDPQEIQNFILSLLKELNNKEARVTILRNGINCTELTLEQTGDTFGLSRERIRQIQIISSNKLRNHILNLYVTNPDIIPDKVRRLVHIYLEQSSKEVTD